MAREERLARMHRWLAEGRGIRAAQARQDLGVSQSTIKRDVEYLRDRYGVPAVWDADRGAWHLAHAPSAPEGSFALPGLWLSAQEIHALLTMQQLLSSLDAGVLLGEHIAPLMKRIGRILGSGLPAPHEVARRIRVLTIGARRLHLPHFEAVASALLQRRRLRVRYHGRGDDRISERELSPQRLVHYRDNWYLDAWCHWRQALRSFSVDAIQAVQVLPDAALDVAEAELQDALGAGYGIVAGQQLQQAVLRFAPERARWVAAERWHANQIGRWDAEGRWVLTVPFADARELVMDILRHVPEVEVLGPQELADEVRRRLRAGLRLMDGLDE